MDVETQIRAWKDARFRRSMASGGLAPNPAGERLVELDEDELRSVWGTQPLIPTQSEGYVCSHSGECNATGNSCWS